jgi:hypothetical protein
MEVTESALANELALLPESLPKPLLERFDRVLLEHATAFDPGYISGAVPAAVAAVVAELAAALPAGSTALSAARAHVDAVRARDARASRPEVKGAVTRAGPASLANVVAYNESRPESAPEAPQRGSRSQTLVVSRPV